MNFELTFKDKEKRNTDYPACTEVACFKSNSKNLIGQIYIAEGKGPHPTVNLFHGFPGYEQNIDLAQSLRRIGYNVFIFHYSGSWGSEGEYSFNNIIEDANSSIRFLSSKEACENFRIDKDKIVLIGHSMGGFAALMTAAKNPQIKNVVSIAGFNVGAFAKSIYNDDEAISYNINRWQRQKQMMPLSGTSSEKLINESLNNREKYDLAEYTEELKKHSTLLIAGIRDESAPVPIHHIPLVNEIKSQNPHDFQDIILDSDHNFSDKRITLINYICSWLQKHL